ncbi:MAG: formylglycine-generating enzyme family protein, partial [Planctomycetaceae bacterium]|nr:formylglycine-generating enzyme family protein [Planctomycetaceae bacterium]
TVPAFAVSWYDAQSFCRKLTTQIQSGRNLPGDLEVRLPTEAQWEYACRAEQPTRFSFGSDPGEVLAKTFAQYKASFEKTPRRFPAPVGKKEPNPWGLRDMHGNVAEWCLDVFSSQPRAGVDPDQSGGASMKVIRGGHITSTHEEILSTSREERNTDDTSEFIGFRPVIVFENFKPEPIASPGTTPIPGAPPGGPYRGTKPGEARRFTSLDLEFRWCPAGTASLGSTPTEPGRGPTENPVTVTFQNGFWISATEITQAQWLTQFSERPWEQYQIANNSQFPAMYLDGRKVQQFCQELTTKERNRKELTSEFEIRLPTESEWEYACRAGTRTAFFYGDDPQYLTLSKYAVYRIIPSRDYEPAVVRSKEPNAWGLYDMLGNAAEWCESVHTMRMLGGTDPTGPQFGGMQVVRGGSYKDQGAMLRSSARKGVAPQEVTEPIGFRIVIATVRN